MQYSICLNCGKPLTQHGPVSTYRMVVSKTKTLKMKTRRPKTYKNEDLRKRRPPTKKKTYENKDPLRKRTPPTKTKTLLFFVGN